MVISLPCKAAAMTAKIFTQWQKEKKLHPRTDPSFQGSIAPA